MSLLYSPNLRRFLHPVALIGIAWALFQLWTAWQGFYHASLQRSIHVAFALSLCFAAYPAFRARTPAEDARLEPAADASDPNTRASGAYTKLQIAVSVVLSILGAGTGAYYWLSWDRLSTRIVQVSSVTDFDLVFGSILLVLLLEACRRVVGIVLPALAGVFLLYQWLGHYIPGALGHGGISFQRLIDYQVLSLQGVYGLPTGVSVNYVFYFVLFAAFLKVSGGGQLFMDLAMRATGHRQGGPAKAAIIGSSLMGTMSGSAIGNVASTGVFTIPLMKKAGYSARFSGAVEALASTGGQLMPPIMGAAAFIMAELMGRPYFDVVLAAIIPAVAYYFAAYMMVHLQAKKRNIAPSAAIERGEAVAARLHLLLPLAILVYHMAAGYSLQMSAFRAIIGVVIVSFLRKATRLNLERLLEAMSEGAKQAMTVTIPAATAGIIIGVISYTGLGLKISTMIIDISGGLLLLALPLVMLVAIILGMGMPTSGAYIMAAVLLAPALIQLGVEPMAAHLFVLYFAVLSMVTPPVALAAFVAAGISGDTMMGTAWQAFKLSFAAFLVPFAFVYNPALIMEGAWFDTAFSSVTLMFGVASLAAAVIGYGLAPLGWAARGAHGLAAVLLINPDKMTDMAGAVLLALVVSVQWWMQRRPVPTGSVQAESNPSQEDLT